MALHAVAYCDRLKWGGVLSLVASPTNSILPSIYHRPTSYQFTNKSCFFNKNCGFTLIVHVLYMSLQFYCCGWSVDFRTVTKLLYYWMKVKVMFRKFECYQDIHVT